jgi:glycosyltransferase 2 family protein
MTPARKIVKIGGRVLICALLLAWIFHAIFMNEARSSAAHRNIAWNELSKVEQWQTAWRIGPAELWQTVSSVSLLAFVASLGVVAVTILLGVIRWRMVLAVQGLHLPFRRALEISFVAHFFNSFLLGSTGGDLMKAYYAARETHHKKTEAVTTVFVDRLIGLWSMLFFAVLMMLFNTQLLLNNPRLTAPALMILLMLTGCSGVLFVAFWGGISKRFPTARHYLRKLPKGDLLERSLDACRAFGTQRAFLLEASLISLVLNIICVLHAIVLARGLHLEISPWVLFTIVPIIISLAALPITPSGLGVRENLFVMMLTIPAIGIPATSALSLSLLIYAGGFFWSIVGGFVYLCLKQTQHLEEFTQADAGAEDGK